MRIMIDTNVLISALLFPSEKMNELFKIITSNHAMVLSSYVVDELYKVIERKFPTKIQIIEDLLSRMSYELVYTPKTIKKQLIEIRDKSDYPVIHTAIIEGVDTLITGDKDFQDLEIEKPEILTPNEFLEKYK
ncbi:MAG TPA: putative toxin-antitoxin system toxin component, PIN family [Clostridium sp.]|nr:putative toxin-antitoxin system toxin component, PIN family [Clostridium sp.]